MKRYLDYLLKMEAYVDITYVCSYTSELANIC